MRNVEISDVFGMLDGYDLAKFSGVEDILDGADGVQAHAGLGHDTAAGFDDQRGTGETLGIAEGGLSRLIKKSYSLLGLISYLTSGEDETRAWTITKGTKAPQAAGKIHSDFERGFIRAEVVSFDDLVKYGTMNAVKEAGALRSEGKEYVVKDGDVMFFRFNV